MEPRRRGTRSARDVFVRVDGVYNRGTHFLIGRTVGTVENPVVGGPDRVVNLESSVGTRYRGLFVTVEKRAGRHRLLASYTLSKADNYANDDQIPFSSGPIDPNDLEREYRPEPERPPPSLHVRGHVRAARWASAVAPLLTLSSGVPMDILMPDASTRVPTLSRNAGGRALPDGGRAQRVPARPERLGWHRRRAAAAGARRRPLQRQLQLPRPARVAALRPGRHARRSRRSSRSSTSST